MPSPLARIRVAVLVSALAGLAALPVTPKPRPPAPPTWTQVDALIKDQKFQEASGLVDRLLESAKQRRDEADWTKALVRGVQLRIGLGSYETAIRFLKEQPWPPGLLPLTTLDLLYGQALVQYERAFSWEIGQREKVASANDLDLKLWTREQIFDEAQKAYRRAWDRRAGLGELPVGALAEYVEPNDYPKDVRGTLRDAVSYLTVELLADSALWTPALSADLYTLDLSALLADDGHAADARLADPKAHPLEKLAAVLGDLESWHASQGRRAPALEARIERARRLTDAFASEAWRITIREDLEKRLERYRSVPWWSMGMAELAALFELEPTADNLVRAREAAIAGRSGFPSSLGGRRCAQIADRLAAPEYLLSSMVADAPDRRSIQLEHKNLARLWFRAYRLDLQERIAEASDEYLLPSRSTVERLLLTGHPDAEWRVDLPATPDFKRHRTFVTPPISARGLWVVVASARADFAANNNLVTSTAIILGNLALVTQTDPSWIEARVVAADTGRPVKGAEVRLVSRGWDAQGGHPLLATLVSDGDGLVRFDYDPSLAHRSLFLTALKDGDVALDSNTFSLSLPEARREATEATLVYTDRPIYRPLQKILWKVVAYGGVPTAGKFRVSPGSAVTVALHDQNNQVVETRTVTTNAYGSAAGEFQIPAGRALGMWMIRTSPSGWAGVRVEEYKRPTFEVQWNDPAVPLQLNREATITGSARYYFGLPVSNGLVRWSVTRQPRLPYWWFWEHHLGLEDVAVVVARGTSPLKPDGTFEASFRAEAAPGRADAAELVYQFQLSAEVTDEGGETRSGARAFRLGNRALDATIRMERNFFREGAPGSMTIVRTDLDGAPRAGAGRWQLVSLVEPERVLLPSDQPAPPSEWSGADPITPGDRQRPRWAPGDSLEVQLHAWKDGRSEAEGALEHDAKGEATVRLPALRPGAWRLRYETRDESGGIARASRDFLVAGGKTPVRLAGVLLAERDSVGVGETARLLAFSGLPDQAFYLETLRDGRVISGRMLVGAEEALIEIPVREEDRGGFCYRLSLVADHQFVSASARVLVPWDDERLHVSFSTFRDRIRPGARETWRVKVEIPPGAAAEERVAELLAEMYDRSLDAFALSAPPDPVALYPDRTWGGSLRTNLGESGGLRIYHDAFGVVAAAVALRPDRLKFLEGYGIGGPGVRGGVRTMAKAEAAPQRAPAAAAVDETASASYIGTNEGAAATAVELPPEPVLRSDFSETAFWKPQLLTDADGSAVIEFQVPDSVTSWNVWVHALTRDLKAGSLHRETRSVKDLMVRPYVPRFLREGDRAELKVVVNNASDRAMSGTVTFDILDTEANRSVLADFGLTPEAASRPFAAGAGASADVSFSLAAPRRVGAYAIKATAVSGDFSDGELRPVPVLPGRMQLSQSRFAALRGGETRMLSFPDMAKSDDPSRIDEQFAVTVDAQLFYSVLNALPYLVNYPYECVEQTLNRFVSTGIVASLFREYPAVEKMAQELARRDTPLDAFAAPDPTRRMALEETPWLETARGGKDAGAGLVKVLDPRAAAAERETSLAKLRQAQIASGAFPWWPGGPPSPYMTLYVMYGFARASEAGVDMPKDVVQRGWGYLARTFHEEYEKRMAEDRCSPEWLTFLAYVATCYPDPTWMSGAVTPAERKAILDFSFKHWREQSPYLKGMLALTLARSGRPKDAALVWDSVMDSSKTDRDLGTYWAPEDRAWLWYEDTIETQAFALRALMELAPADARRHGLVQWLFLNKKLNQWKSTRATAEVLYALVAYLKREGALAGRESVTVALGGQTTAFEFDPDRYTGKRNQVVVPGERIDPKRDADVTVSKTGAGLAFASATWSFSTDRLPAEDRGDLFAVSRRYYRREPTASGFELRPLAEGAALSPGDEVEVQLSIRAKHAAEYVHLRDPRAAGLEPGVATSGYRWDLGLVRYEELRDSGTNFFFEWLPAGEHTLKYRVRANMAGTFRVGPATLQSMYAPEFSAYSAGATIRVK